MADILIADDNPHARHMVEEVLGSEGHRVSTVSDGKAALQHIENSKPDLVLLDTKMPRADGFTVCRAIRSKPDLADLQIVMLAGPLDPLDREKAKADGFDLVLQKPLDAAGLLSAVNGLLGGDPSPSGADSGAPNRSKARTVDPLTDLVEKTLGGEKKRVFEGEIRQAVEEGLTAAMPAIIDRIAVRVSRKIKDA